MTEVTVDRERRKSYRNRSSHRGIKVAVDRERRKSYRNRSSHRGIKIAVLQIMMTIA